MKVLIIEDDKGLRTGLAFALAQDGMETVCASDVEEGLRLFRSENPDGIVLDLNLPDGDGNELCRSIRRTSQIPILMLTARDMESDELMGLASGADDYMTKPFSVAVLKMRLKKLMERAAQPQSAEANEIHAGGVCMDLSGIRVTKDGKDLECSVTEYRLLRYFLGHPGQVLTQDQILGAVWDSEGRYVNANTLQVNIRRLRRKLGDDPANPRYIRTIHGIGYLWEAAW